MINSVPYTLEFSQCSHGFSEWKVVNVSRLLLYVSWLWSFFNVVVALLGVNFNTNLRSHFLLFLLLLLLLILPLLILNIQWTLIIITLVIGRIFCNSLAFFLFYYIKSLSNFLFLIKPLSTPNSKSPSRNVFSTRGLVTSLLCGGGTYSTSSAMFVTGIICLFRSNCPWGVQKYCLMTPIFRNCQKNSGETSVGVNLERKEWKVLSCLICLMGTYSVF